MTTELTVLGWSLRVFDGEEEPRICEGEIAARLKCERRNLRPIIRRLIKSKNLNESHVRCELSTREAGATKREFKEYWLDVEGAIQVAIEARTEQGRALRHEIIEVYIAYRRGALAPVQHQTAMVSIDALTQMLSGLFERYMTALTTSVTEILKPRSLYIDEIQIKYLKRLATKGCKQHGRKSMKPFWVALCETYDFPYPAKVFSTVFVEKYKEVVLDLKALSAQPERSKGKVTALPDTTPAITPHRPATEKDLGVQIVAQRLKTDLNYSVNWGHLSRPNGIYEASCVDLLRLAPKGKVSKSDIDPEGAPYLDESRYAWLLHWMRTNAGTASAIFRMQQQLTLKELAHGR